MAITTCCKLQNATSGNLKRILCLIEIEINSFCEDKGYSLADFMKNCGNETNNFVLLTPFYDFVRNKFNLYTYESNGTIGTPNQLVDRPSKPKLGFYVNDFLPKLKAELDKNDPLSSNQVDDLKQSAPRLQMQFESVANGDSKRPKLNDLEKHGRPRQILSGFKENAIIYPTCPNVIEEFSKRQEFFLPWGEGESTKIKIDFFFVFLCKWNRIKGQVYTIF